MSRYKLTRTKSRGQLCRVNYNTTYKCVVDWTQQFQTVRCKTAPSNANCISNMVAYTRTTACAGRTEPARPIRRVRAVARRSRLHTLVLSADRNSRKRWKNNNLLTHSCVCSVLFHKASRNFSEINRTHCVKRGAFV